MVENKLIWNAELISIMIAYLSGFVSFATLIFFKQGNFGLSIVAIILTLFLFKEAYGKLTPYNDKHHLDGTP